MSKLIGITGPIGHGKTSLAECFMRAEPASLHLESSDLIIEVAEAMHVQLAKLSAPDSIDAVNSWIKQLPAILNDIVHVQPDYESIKISKTELFAKPTEYEKLFAHLVTLKNDPSRMHQRIMPENKNLYRPFLQWIGGYLVENVGAGVWYDELVRRAKTAAANGTKLCVMGGVRYPAEADIIRQSKGIVIAISRPDFGELDTTDPTERERSRVHTDTTVINNGTLKELETCSRQILKDIAGGKLKQTYHSRQI